MCCTYTKFTASVGLEHTTLRLKHHALQTKLAGLLLVPMCHGIGIEGALQDINISRRRKNPDKFSPF